MVDRHLRYWCLYTDGRGSTLFCLNANRFLGTQGKGIVDIFNVVLHLGSREWYTCSVRATKSYRCDRKDVNTTGKYYFRFLWVRRKGNGMVRWNFGHDSLVASHTRASISTLVYTVAWNISIGYILFSLHCFWWPWVQQHQTGIWCSSCRTYTLTFWWSSPILLLSAPSVRCRSLCRCPPTRVPQVNCREGTRLTCWTKSPEKQTRGATGQAATTICGLQKKFGLQQDKWEDTNVAGLFIRARIGPSWFPITKWLTHLVECFYQSPSSIVLNFKFKACFCRGTTFSVFFIRADLVEFPAWSSNIWTTV